MRFSHSQKLENLITNNSHLESLSEWVADATTSHDLDGSDMTDIMTLGTDLAEKALSHTKNPIVLTAEDQDNTWYVFGSDENDALTRANKGLTDYLAN